MVSARWSLLLYAWDTESSKPCFICCTCNFIATVTDTIVRYKQGASKARPLLVNTYALILVTALTIFITIHIRLFLMLKLMYVGGN